MTTDAFNRQATQFRRLALQASTASGADADTAEDATQIRILEIYASDAAYQAHLKTEHFQKYKQGTLHMVKSLKLPTMQPLDPETMKLIFKKK